MTSELWPGLSLQCITAAKLAGYGPHPTHASTVHAEDEAAGATRASTQQLTNEVGQREAQSLVGPALQTGPRDEVAQLCAYTGAGAGASDEIAPLLAHSGAGAGAAVKGRLGVRARRWTVQSQLPSDAAT